MPVDPLEPQRCAELLSALASPERLRIVRFLVEAPHTVTEIVGMLNIPAVNVSHHLAVLKSARLIEKTKKGRFSWYALAHGLIEQMLAAGIPREAINLGCCQIVLPKHDIEDRTEPVECVPT